MRKTLNDFIREVLISSYFKKHFDVAYRGSPSEYEYHMELCKEKIGMALEEYTTQEREQTTTNIKRLQNQDE